MGMSLGGTRYSDTQLRALREIGVLGRSRLGQYKSSTKKRLCSCGLIEVFVPEATTLAMAERGRWRPSDGSGRATGRDDETVS
jgi:hypothetical protein